MRRLSVPDAKLELPASQLELNTPPASTVGEAIARARRRRGARPRRRLEGVARLAVGRRAPVRGAAGRAQRGRALRRDRAPTTATWPARSSCARCRCTWRSARRERTLAVYNALRGYLPELAALAANAPFHAGRDTGLRLGAPADRRAAAAPGRPAGVRVLGGVTRTRCALGRAGAAARGGGSCARTSTFGTLELRVCDAQTTLEEAAAVTAFAHCLVAWLAEQRRRWTRRRTWRIAENRWAALRDGVEATFKDLSSIARARRCATSCSSGSRRSRRWPSGSGCASELALVPRLIVRNGAMRQREVGARARRRLARGALPHPVRASTPRSWVGSGQCDSVQERSSTVARSATGAAVGGGRGVAVGGGVGTILVVVVLALLGVDVPVGGGGPDVSLGERAASSPRAARAARTPTRARTAGSSASSTPCRLLERAPGRLPRGADELLHAVQIADRLRRRDARPSARSTARPTSRSTSTSASTTTCARASARRAARSPRRT